MLGIDADSVCHWETGYIEPKVYMVPRIVDFLGYVPEERAASFPEALRSARRLAGLSQERLAKRAHVDESTIARWERGDSVPLPATVERLCGFFRKLGRPLPEFGPEGFYGPERRAEAARNAWDARKKVRNPAGS
jgi:transcriptional regulator with XRE-family HTH domain